MPSQWAEDLASIAQAMGNASRATMLVALMDTRARTAAEMAASAGISRGTATAHLNQLVDAGLLEEVRQGRHRYVRLKNSAVAGAIEALIALAPPGRPAASSYREHKHDAELQHGRTCYGHLAGALGVALALDWRRAGLVTPTGLDLTDAGHAWSRSLGIELPAHPSRPLVRPCLDWTERLDHAAGILPDLLVTTALEHGWLRRGSHPRSIRLTAEGAQVFAREGLLTTLPGL